MKKDLVYKDPRTWGMQVYHKYVAQSMAQGFKWVRYERNGNTLTIFNLRNYPGVRSSVTSKECADRYERWYQWMKRKTTSQSTHTGRYCADCGELIAPDDGFSCPKCGGVCNSSGRDGKGDLK